MKRYIVSCIAAVAFLGAASRAPESVASQAGAAFAAGDFEAAYAGYCSLIALHDPENAEPQTLLGCGRMLLYKNLNSWIPLARKYLEMAARSAATADSSKRLLSTLEQRSAANAAFDTGSGTVHVPFVQRDPLPLVSVTANGKQAYFLIDTGAPNLVLDPDFAKEIGLTVTAAGTGTFAGGRTTAVSVATLPRFAIGPATAANLAVDILATRRFSFGGSKTVDGIIGTGFLMHYLSTLDYGHNELVLQPRNATPSTQGATVVPMWLVGDHFIFARGAIGAAPEGLMLIDTGLAGGGVMPSEATMAAAHLNLDTAHAGTGVGGGGQVKVIPFVASSVRVGTFSRTNVAGLYTPGGSPLSMFPFAVGGIVSHGFFSPGSLTFDFAGMRLIVRP